MTLRPSFLVVGPDDAGVAKPQDARLAMAGLLSGAGVLSGMTVTGSSDGPNMIYTVAAGAAAAARGSISGNGLYLIPNDGPVDVDSGSPAPGSGTRYDVVYVQQHDGYDFADSDSDSLFGVAVGTAGSSPAVPDVPDGAVALAIASVGTSIASASLASIVPAAPAFAVGGCSSFAHYENLSAHSIPDSTETTIVGWSRINSLVPTGWTYSGGVWTCTIPGEYTVSSRVGYQTVAVPAGIRQARLFVGATAVDNARDRGDATYATALALHWGGYLNANDTFSLAAYQSQGAAVLTATTGDLMNMHIQRIG